MIEIRYATRCTFSRLLYHSLSSKSIIIRFLEIQIYFHQRRITIVSVPNSIQLKRTKAEKRFHLRLRSRFASLGLSTLRFSSKSNSIKLKGGNGKAKKGASAGIDAIMVIMTVGCVHTSGLTSVSRLTFAQVSATLYPERASVSIQEFADHPSFPHSSRATLWASFFASSAVLSKHTFTKAFFSFFSFVKIASIMTFSRIEINGEWSVDRRIWGKRLKRALLILST